MGKTRAISHRWLRQAGALVLWYEAKGRLVLSWVVCLGLSFVLLGLFVVGIDYKGYLLTKESLANGVLGY